MQLPIELSAEELDYIIESAVERLAKANKKPSRRPKALCADEPARYQPTASGRHFATG